MIKNILFGVVIVLFTACSATINSHNVLPKIEKTQQKSQISVFKLENYTDTPRAGKRAANIAQGLLAAKGYHVVNHLDKGAKTLQEVQTIAKADGSKYFLSGGVSEWRYKTGIDGEPAVSLRLALYKSDDRTLVWSATGSDSAWGISSVGTLAQTLIEKMLQE